MQTNPKRIATALAAATLLATPGVASAATPSLFSAGGKTVKKFALSVNATKGTKAEASVSLLRAKGSSTQYYAVLASKGVHYAAKANLSSATLKVSLGSRGKISMRFHATRKASHAIPKGCKGKAGAIRKGVLTGTLKVKFDSGYFGTVRRSSQTAYLAKGGKLVCAGSKKVSTDKVSLSAFPAGEGTGTSFFIGKNKAGRVTESASSFTADKATGVDYSRFIFATGKSSAFTSAADLSSATATGIGPFLGGTLAFKASGAPTGKFATGTVGGSFVAKFVSGGRATVKPGEVGTLSTH